MARIYSASLWRGQSVAAGEINSVVGAPGGTIVIRSMDFFWNGFPPQMPGGFEVYDVDRNILWRITAPLARAATPYHWEGRQVMGGGESLFINALEANWHWWISGYNLAAPIPV